MFIIMLLDGRYSYRVFGISRYQRMLTRPERDLGGVRLCELIGGSIFARVDHV